MINSLTFIVEKKYKFCKEFKFLKAQLIKEREEQEELNLEFVIVSIQKMII